MSGGGGHRAPVEPCLVLINARTSNNLFRPPPISHKSVKMRCGRSTELLWSMQWLGINKKKREKGKAGVGDKHGVSS